MTLNKTTKNLYKRVFGSPDGQLVLKDLMDFCHFMQPTHDATNSHNSAYYEGKRRVLLRVLSFMAPNKAVDVYNNPNNLINDYEGEF